MKIEVHIEWEGETHFVGILYAAEKNAAVSFEYASEWLNRANNFAIDPTGLPLRPGQHHIAKLFGAIQDCGPDRWGRILIERAVRKHVLDKKPYRDLDYVLALDDASRIGALRFRVNADSPFLAVGSGKIPPIVRLGTLLTAANAIHGETETAQDIRFLLGAGSPLGGARPKSAVRLSDGNLAIAKFPKPDDIRDIAAGEILALTLAEKAGISVAGHRLIKSDGKSISLITRFDRDALVVFLFFLQTVCSDFPRMSQLHILYSQMESGNSAITSLPTFGNSGGGLSFHSLPAITTTIFVIMVFS